MHANVVSRRKVIARLGARLTQSGYPRVGLLLSIIFAACVGFLSSASLLALGMQTPAIRYVLALGIAYGVLLLLLRLWLLRRHDDRQVDFLLSMLIILLMLGIAIPLIVPGGDSIGDLFR